MSDVSELPSLLFRQRLMLAVLAGSVSARDFVLGVAILALVVLFSMKNGTVRLALLPVCFLLGLAVTCAALPEAPDCPSWASVPRRSVLAEGRIVSVTGLPGGRVRVLLENLRPAAMPSALPDDTAEKVRKALNRKAEYTMPAGARKGYPGRIVEDTSSPVPGLVSMTLYADDMAESGRPVSGQTLRGLMRVYPAVGSVNPGTSDLGVYWADRDVWHNARLNRTRKGPLFLELTPGEGAVYRAAGIRESWRSMLMDALTAEGEASSFSPDTQKPRGMWTEPSCSQGRAMLAALLFGDRSGLTPRTVDLFTRAGLVHSLALSGQHLALAAMAGTALVICLSLAFSDLFLCAPRRVLMVAAGIPFALLYLFLGGAPFSLIRAAFMMLTGACFLCLRRCTAPLDALFAAAALLFLGWPLVAFDLSAQLSVLAVAGILLSMPLLSALRRRFPPPGKMNPSLMPGRRRIVHAVIRWTGTMVILSFAAQMAVLPILISVFGAVSLNFWMNLLWLPPLTFITLPAAAIGLVLLVMFGVQPLSMLLFSVAAWPADAMLRLLHVCDVNGWLPMIQCFRPSSLSALGYGVLFTGAMMMLGGRLNRRSTGRTARRLVLCGLLLMPLGQMPAWMDDLRAVRERRVSVTLFDVGQGQAVLVTYPGGRILVDGGGSSSPFFDYGRSILAPALTHRRLPHLDAVVVSHTDMDHARGLRWILEHFRVGGLVWSAVSARDASSDGRALREIAVRRGIPERILGRGDVLPLADGISLEVIWPERDAVENARSEKKLDANDMSLALRLTRDGEGLLLLCGDMTAPALRRLAESGQLLRAEVLVLPHHGAASSFQRKFYDAVDPDIVMASAASFNHYGFPAARVRGEMEKRGIPLYSTSERGCLTVTWSADGRKQPQGELR